MSLPKFPDFQPFSLSHRQEYLNYFSTLENPYCDFSLNDLWIWVNYNNDLVLCELNGNLVLRFTNVFDDNKLYYTLLGRSELGSTLDILVRYGVTELTFLPEETVQSILRDTSYTHTDISEDSDNGDYVYNVDDLVALQGKKYENLRTRINHFTQENNHIEVKELDVTQPSMKKLIKSSIKKWSHAHNDPSNIEFSAIEKHLELASTTPVYAYGLFSNKKLVSIIVFHLPPHKGWLICNHIKCDYTYRDVYGYAFYRLATMAQIKGIKWINLEQDLGKPGLRQFKTLFRPAMFLRRYTITLLQSDAI